MDRQKTIAIPTFVAAIFTGIAIWLVAGPPPPHPAKHAHHGIALPIK